MSKEIIQIEFYFPKALDGAMDKKSIVNSIVQDMREQGSLEYSGYSDDWSLVESISNHLGDGSTSDYIVVSESERLGIEEQVRQTVEKCNRVLSIPAKNFAFVLPYFPTTEDSAFEGVMGLAPYSCVFYLFVAPRKYTPSSLVSTVAHELNHTVYYYYHYDRFGKYTLLDEMIMEGLAENFRERVIGGEISPWAGALAKEEALGALGSMSDLLSQDQALIKSVLFGNSNYKKWTGYSIGYWLVKGFIDKNKNLSWEEIIKADSNEILNSR